MIENQPTQISRNQIRALIGALLVVVIIACVCMSLLATFFGSSDGGEEVAESNSNYPTVDVPRNAQTFTVVANAGVEPWVEAAVFNFNSERIESAAGDTAYASLEIVEAGKMVVNLEAGAAPTMWIPDNQVWTSVPEGNNSYQQNCASIATSPLVIGVWQPLAASLGWPGRELGWLDISSVAADQSQWSYYSGGQFGDELRLGHTHPGLSGSGASTLLALVQAAESTSDAVSVDAIQKPIVQASVGAFESAVSWFSSDTNTLGQTMNERGTQFLGAGVMYESTVIQNQAGDEPIIPIYPFEGTFVATHPACISSNASSAEQSAAEAFRDYLLSAEMQETAVKFGYRPVSTTTDTSTLTGFTGIDLAQPLVEFAPPTVDTILAVQDVWQSQKKPTNLVMVIDTSGSMRGDKILDVINASQQFVGQMSDADNITVVGFDTEPYLFIDTQNVGDNRSAVIQQLGGLEARGDTALFDAIGASANLIDENNSSQFANAMIVLTDGEDTSSYRFGNDASLGQAAAANGTSVFTIAYGSDADEFTLERLAANANGNFFLGDGASITAIYNELSAAFGGSVGVGR